ncbi:MAG: hypothetical protein A2381_02125 [Bdellovibrionales bacterium RIFOXYB1_FULL_37_110]|nr:MAG: hypothetical protein A2417_13430 [Bdellovibrionales bacterium RIFOXYC1_FULL_37_79]OFZ59237.1 MAG: hypothetical protein A2381_02125 [Bdellovibrionales bacterium RIFOXYB1_FULL_37_110]OFZ62863.1 MAG: hypothetical protein A2577_11080 [Bdellovibrionales bacterium RIFOXYD1_FULL_36_51]
MKRWEKKLYNNLILKAPQELKTQVEKNLSVEQRTSPMRMYLVPVLVVLTIIWGATNVYLKRAPSLSIDDLAIIKQWDNLLLYENLELFATFNLEELEDEDWDILTGNTI